MLKFLVDEDLPRSTAHLLRKMGFDTLDVRDCGLIYFAWQFTLPGTKTSSLQREKQQNFDFSLHTKKRPKAIMVCIDSFKLQTVIALIKSFCGGSRGAVFSKRAPLAAGGINFPRKGGALGVVFFLCLRFF
jgi:hypothetical protein